MAIAAEIVPNGLHIEVKFPGDAMYATIGQGVLDPPQLVESDVHDEVGLGW
jgi:hypothetical protein